MTTLIRDIIAATADASDYSWGEIIGTSREHDLAHWRACAMYLARTLTNQSYPQIGRAFRRDHTTVLYAFRRITAASDELTLERVDAIRNIAARNTAERLLTLSELVAA